MSLDLPPSSLLAAIPPIAVSFHLLVHKHLAVSPPKLLTVFKIFFLSPVYTRRSQFLKPSTSDSVLFTLPQPPALIVITFHFSIIITCTSSETSASSILHVNTSSFSSLSTLVFPFQHLLGITWFSNPLAISTTKLHTLFLFCPAYGQGPSL